MKSVLCRAASLGALAFVAAQAHAQDTAVGQATEEAAAEGQANEIIVTAQFRGQRVQDTPLAITAYSGELLEKRSANDIVNAAAAVPNVNLSRGQGGFGQFASTFIRGVGQSDIHFAVEPGVGMYVDDVYYGVMSGATFQLLDADRVEVSRGPQGTLSGKNSIGGSIKLYSKRPTQDSDAYIEVTGGGRNLIAGRGAASITIVPDRLYIRVSAAGRRRDGYLQRLDYGCVTGSTTTTARAGPSCVLGTQGGENVWSARAAIRWTPTDGIENNLVFDTTQDNSENPAQKTVVQSAAWAGSANYITPADSYTNYETYVSMPKSSVPAPDYSMSPNSTLDSKGVVNNLSIDLSKDITLTSITAYRRSSTKLSAQLDQTPASIADQSWQLLHKQFTQEIRLSGSFGSLIDWTLGGYYYHSTGVSEGRISYAGGVAPGGGGVNLDTVFRDPVKSISKSAFIHAVIHPTEKLSLTFGGRYTDDRKDFTFNRYDAYGHPHPTLGSLVGLTRTFAGDRFDYRINADYKLSDAAMIYGQVSTGYKGGGINPRPFIASQALPFDPETLTTFEGGLKTSLFDRHFMLNAAGYYSKYKQIQGTLLRCDAISPSPGYPCTQTTNIGDANIKGLELEAAVRNLGGFGFDGSLGYTDFQYTRVAPTSGVTLDMQPVFTPRWTASAGVQYTASLFGGSLTPRFDLTHRSSIYTDPVNAAITHLPSLTLVNARVTWESVDRDWSLALAVTNLFDKFYAEATSVRANAPYFSGAYKLGQPFQWQLSVKRSF